MGLSTKCKNSCHACRSSFQRKQQLIKLHTHTHTHTHIHTYTRIRRYTHTHTRMRARSLTCNTTSKRVFCEFLATKNTFLHQVLSCAAQHSNGDQDPAHTKQNPVVGPGQRLVQGAKILEVCGKYQTFCSWGAGRRILDHQCFELNGLVRPFLLTRCAPFALPPPIGRFSCNTCDALVPRVMWHFTLENQHQFFVPSTVISSF